MMLFTWLGMTGKKLYENSLEGASYPYLSSYKTYVGNLPWEKFETIAIGS